MSRILTAISLLGMLVFSGALAVSVVNPSLIERAGRKVLQIEVEDLAQRALQAVGVDLAVAERVPQVRERLESLIGSAYPLVADDAARQPGS